MSKLMKFDTRVEFENYITTNSNLPFEEALSATNNGVYGSVACIMDTGEIYVNNTLHTSGSSGDAESTVSYVTKDELNEGLSTKQDTITDLATIRSGSELGATSVQPSDISNFISGDGTVTNVCKVSSLPSNPDPNTLYVIVE